MMVMMMMMMMMVMIMILMIMMMMRFIDIHHRLFFRNYSFIISISMYQFVTNFVLKSFSDHGMNSALHILHLSAYFLILCTFFCSVLYILCTDLHCTEVHILIYFFAVHCGGDTDKRCVHCIGRNISQ